VLARDLLASALLASAGQGPPVPRDLLASASQGPPGPSYLVLARDLPGRDLLASVTRDLLGPGTSYLVLSSYLPGPGTYS
jgi:hypothetical protein